MTSDHPHGPTCSQWIYPFPVTWQKKPFLSLQMHMFAEVRHRKLITELMQILSSREGVLKISSVKRWLKLIYMERIYRRWIYERLISDFMRIKQRIAKLFVLRSMITGLKPG